MQRIDLGPVGPAGIEARIWPTRAPAYCWVGGSDHLLDWYHHVQVLRKWRFETPAKRERDAANEIFNHLVYSGASSYTIGGHSLGGAVVNEMGLLFDALKIPYHAYLFGPKQPINEVCKNVTVYQVRGDGVPFCHPFRPRYPEITVLDRGNLSFWKAHGPDTYDDARKACGLK